MKLSTSIALGDSNLRRAWTWLNENRDARMTVKSKIAHLILEYGGSFKPADAAVLRIAGLQVSCTGGLHNLLGAWDRKAHTKLKEGRA